jgi:hypothetical protein
MQTTPTNHSLQDFKRFVHNAEVRAIVRDLDAAREALPKVEARVAEILAPVFEGFEFWSAGFRGRPPERIFDERKLYLCGPGAFETPEMHAWDTARHEALVAAGYDLPGFGYCPASMAACKVSELEKALLDRAASKLHPCFATVIEKAAEVHREVIDLLCDAVRDLNKAS